MAPTADQLPPISLINDTCFTGSTDTWALCGHCVGTVWDCEGTAWALCGHCEGTVWELCGTVMLQEVVAYTNIV